VSVRVKICGLRDEAGLEAAVAAGADALGFVLAPSPRRVTPGELRALLRLVPRGIERIAVFARATRAELEAALELEVDGLQAEIDSEWPALGERFALPVLRDGPELEARASRAPRIEPRTGSLRGALVLDGPLGGGRGVPVDLARAARLAALRPLVLAGGLTPAGVAARILAVRPYAVDVSSGVERLRAHKDPARILAFVRAVRALAAGETETRT
jgi:phosphoribosylanthranilate isomerase